MGVLVGFIGLNAGSLLEHAWFSNWRYRIISGRPEIGIPAWSNCCRFICSWRFYARTLMPRRRATLIWVIAWLIIMIAILFSLLRSGFNINGLR